MSPVIPAVSAAEPTPRILRADARSLPLAEDSVDLVVTSPPYYGLRSYQDGGQPYDGQIGAESTPAEYLDALLDVTRECVRVLKPTGSIWVNLGDRYSTGNSGQSALARLGERYRGGGHSDAKAKRPSRRVTGRPTKSLLGIPWRYAIRCMDELGLVLRAEVVWSKPNGLPESVTDRVRRSHETWFHFTLQPHYYSAVGEIREPSDPRNKRPQDVCGEQSAKERARRRRGHGSVGHPGKPLVPSPLGKLPGSVWEIATQPLRVPAELGVDHYAAFPMEWPRRLILGWSPREGCTACGQGRRPVEASAALDPSRPQARRAQQLADAAGLTEEGRPVRWHRNHRVGRRHARSYRHQHRRLGRLLPTGRMAGKRPPPAGQGRSTMRFPRPRRCRCLLPKRPTTPSSGRAA